MKRILATLALASLASFASAQTYSTNLVPGGAFNSTDPEFFDLTNNTAQGGNMTFDWPASGGNPGGYARIDGTAIGNTWAVWVLGQPTPIPLTTLGLSNNFTYKFLMDMKIESGPNIGGFKVESWGPSGQILPNSGDLRPISGTGSWATYEFTYTISPGADSLKAVGLWGSGSVVAFDNVRVIAVTSQPLTAAITTPTAFATVNTNFTINATALVLPGVVTNVNFYLGPVGPGTLLGSDDTAPFSLSVTGAPLGSTNLTVVAQDDNGNSATSSVVNITVSAAVVETIALVDPSKNWLGYMNVYETPQNFGGPVFNQPWGVGALSAAFSGVGPASVLTLKPAPLQDTNPFWYDYSDPSYPTGMVGAVAFKDMEATMYVQPADGTLNGNKVTFNGFCNTNTLVSPGSTNRIGNGWTNYAFVKDLAPDYSSSVVSTIALTSGVPFSVSLTTIANPARHIQYGFITRGPNVWPTDVDNYGKVEIRSLDANPTNVYVDSSKTWNGFMNVSNLPQNGGAYQFGNGWGTADLCAVFNGFGLTLSPNTIGDPNAYWYTPSGGPGAVGNKIMDASMYVEIGSLPGRNLIFSGTVLSNTLVNASNTNAVGNGWTSVAFIKDFASDYSSFNTVTVPLTPGAFSINLNTVNDPARHVQYGFETVGPDVWVTDVAAFGNVLLGNVGVFPTTITAGLSGGNINLSFPTQLGKTYRVQYKTNLTDVSWSTLTTTNGTGLNAVVSDPSGSGQRFYRLSIP